MQNRITIVIADDHKVVRDGLKSLLSNIQDFVIEGEVENGEQLLEFYEQKSPDIALIDITMPVMNGLEALKILSQSNSTMKGIILSMHEDPDYIIKAVQNGAKGYLLKNTDEKELELAIRTVADGGKYFNSSVSKIMIENISTAKALQMNSEIMISVRETEILKLVAEGLSNKLIADRLKISSRTVETHRLNLLRKMHVNNTAELVKKAMDSGML